LKSTICEWSERDYRTRRRFPERPSRSRVVSALYRAPERASLRSRVRPPNVTRLLTATSLSWCGVGASDMCVDVVPNYSEVLPSRTIGNECVTIVRRRFSSISTEQDRARVRLGFKGSMPQRRRK